MNTSRSFIAVGRAATPRGAAAAREEPDEDRPALALSLPWQSAGTAERSAAEQATTIRLAIMRWSCKHNVGNDFHRQGPAGEPPDSQASGQCASPVLVNDFL